MFLRFGAPDKNSKFTECRSIYILLFHLAYYVFWQYSFTLKANSTVLKLLW